MSAMASTHAGPRPGALRRPPRRSARASGRLPCPRSTAPRPSRRPQQQHRVARRLRRLLRRRITVRGRGPAREQSVESPGEQRRRREVPGGHPDAVRSHRERQHLERLLEPALVLQEIGVRHEAQPQAGERLGADGDGVGDAVQVGALGRIGGQLAQVAPDGVELPEDALLRVGARPSRASSRSTRRDTKYAPSASRADTSRSRSCSARARSRNGAWVSTSADDSTSPKSCCGVNRARPSVRVTGGRS